MGGRPTRGMEKQFGKKVVTGYGVYDSYKPPSSQMTRATQGGYGGPSQANSMPALYP